jgi:MFS family permease
VLTEGVRDVRRDLRLSLADAAGYGAMAGVAEVYLPAFGLALGMSPVPAGLLASVPLLAGGALQLLAPRAIQRARSLRGWVVMCAAIQAVAFIPLLVLALSGRPSTGVLFASASLYWAAGMAAAAGWTPWMARVVPARVRGRFFGRRQGVLQASMLVGLVAAGASLQAVAGTGHVLHVYACMFAVACIARLSSAAALARQGRGVELVPRRRMRFRHIAPKLRGNPRAHLLGYLIAALAAAAISGPFITPYLLHHHHLRYWQYCVFTTTVIVVKIAASPVVGRVLQRRGVRWVLTVSAVAIAPIPLGYLVSDAFLWFVTLQIYSGMAWAGLELGMLMALFDADDDAERTTMQVAFSALQSIGNAGGSLIGGAILGGAGADHHAYMVVFASSSIARFAAAMMIVRWLRRVPKLLAQLPFRVVAGAWTLAIRPWGESIIRPLVEGIGRVRRGGRDEDP